jgi:heme/copper-type cytochrome/quinol oxidase subunit 2
VPLVAAISTSLILAVVLVVILVGLLAGFFAQRYRQRRREHEAHALTAPSRSNPTHEQKHS